jgi:hypothetical protein
VRLDALRGARDAERAGHGQDGLGDRAGLLVAARPETKRRSSLMPSTLKSARDDSDE